MSVTQKVLTSYAGPITLARSYWFGLRGETRSTKLSKMIPSKSMRGLKNARQSRLFRIFECLSTGSVSLPVCFILWLSTSSIFGGMKGSWGTPPKIAQDNVPRVAHPLPWVFGLRGK